MVPLDRVLGVAEVLLVPISLGLLVMAIARPRPRRFRWAVALTVGTALTVAQPLGIVADGHPDDPRSASAEAVDPTDIHVAGVLGGIPVMPFKLYSRDDLLRGQFAENTPSQTLRARSWFWLPMATNSSKIVDCWGAAGDPPCWDGDESQFVLRGHTFPIGSPGLKAKRGKTCPSLDPDARTLTLYEDGDRDYWVVLRSSPSTGAPCGEAYLWKLSLGLASPMGLGYWLLGGGLIFLALWRRSLGE